MSWTTIKSLLLKIAYPTITGALIGAQQYFTAHTDPQQWVLSGLLFGVGNAVLSSLRKTFFPFA